MKKTLFLFLLLSSTTFLQAQTISEKKSKLTHPGADLSPDLQRGLRVQNQLYKQRQQKLQSLYQEAEQLHRKEGSTEQFQELLEQIQQVKAEIADLQKEWRERNSSQDSGEGYALWHQPETTLSQLVIDYGSSDYVYLFTQDVASIKINVGSNLPIPRSTWSEMLEHILTYNGIGIRQLNPYTRQLYLLKDDKSGIQTITSNREDLRFVPPMARISFVISPEPSEVRRIWLFLEKFVNPKTTNLHLIGRDIFVVGPVNDVQDLLKLYDFAANSRGDKEYKIITLKRVNTEEMAKILGAIFDQFSSSSKTNDSKGKNSYRIVKPGDEIKKREETTGLRIITLGHISQALFLVGTQEEIRKAEEIIREVESQVGDAKEKVIYWYTTQHSDATELSNILAKVYLLLVRNQGVVGEDGTCEINDELEQAIAEIEQEQSRIAEEKKSCPDISGDNFCLNTCNYVWDSSPKELKRDRDVNKNRSNFIVDPKTGAIVMVVESSVLPRLKNLIRKLDVPKKMVQIEVLLFEKRMKKETEFGLNLLKIGDQANQVHSSSATWNDSPTNLGVFQYFLSRTKSASGFPAFDLIYRFLMTRDDVQINATPSVVAMNQTPAKIDIEEEISVRTGVYQVPTTGAVTLKDSFQRARYGIKIEITPTIHSVDDYLGVEDTSYVTLDTNVVFETIQRTRSSEQPDVIRRLINNTVRVPDGQTVILGGLRRKITEDRKEKIPFIGDLPGIGKLFSITSMEDKDTEMYMFITPKIINDPSEDFCKLRTQELCRRPGDVPLFLSNLVKARECEKNRLMGQSIEMLLGREKPRIEIPLGEYDGRCK